MHNVKTKVFTLWTSAMRTLNAIHPRSLVLSCRSLFVLVPIFVWLLYRLSFDLRILISSLVSSTFPRTSIWIKYMLSLAACNAQLKTGYAKYFGVFENFCWVHPRSLVGAWCPIFIFCWCSDLSTIVCLLSIYFMPFYLRSQLVFWYLQPFLFFLCQSKLSIIGSCQCHICTYIMYCLWEK
jgi:hypothetical protein